MICCYHLPFNAMTSFDNNNNIFHLSWENWLSYGLMGFIVFILLPLSWTHYIWNSFKYDHEKPDSAIVKFLCKCSEMITQSFMIRILIYVVVCVLFALNVFFEIVSNNSRDLGEIINAFIILA